MSGGPVRTSAKADSRYHPYERRLTEARKKLSACQSEQVRLESLLADVKSRQNKFIQEKKKIREEASLVYGKATCPKLAEIVDDWYKTVAHLTIQGEKYVPTTNLCMHSKEGKEWRNSRPDLEDDDSYKKDVKVNKAATVCYGCGTAGTRVRWEAPDDQIETPIQINAESKTHLTTIRISLRQLDYMGEFKCGFRVQYWWSGLPNISTMEEALPSTLTSPPTQPLCEQCLVACLASLRQKVQQGGKARVSRFNNGKETKVECEFQWGVFSPSETAFEVVENTLDRWEQATAALGDVSGADSEKEDKEDD